MSETKTIEQQLQEFAANPVVDGVRWDVNYYDGLVDGFSTFICGRKIHIYAILDTGEERIFSKWNLNAIELFGLPMKDKELAASTPADACREAIRICRERVAELAAELNMIPSEADIHIKAAEIYPIIPENDFDDSLIDYTGYVAQQIHEASIYRSAAKWATSKLLNQPTQGAKTTE